MLIKYVRIRRLVSLRIRTTKAHPSAPFLDQPLFSVVLL
jgi:hypothetical protein